MAVCRNPGAASMDASHGVADFGTERTVPVALAQVFAVCATISSKRPPCIPRVFFFSFTYWAIGSIKQMVSP